MSDFFGNNHSTSESTSNNANMGLLNSTWTPTMNLGAGAAGLMGGLLGVNGSQAQSQAFDNWRNSTGYQFGLDQGTSAIRGNAATQGLLNSGATAKALQTYGQNYANTQFGNYFNQLSGLLGQGLQAGGLLANAGQQSHSTSTGAASDGGIQDLAAKGIGLLLGK